jgi:hypothetical protein
MRVSSLQTHDAHVGSIVEHLCAKIRAHFPEATVDVGAHPATRGAMIDAQVSTDDDAVLDLVNPVLDVSLLAEGIAISVRVLGPS